MQHLLRLEVLWLKKILVVVSPFFLTRLLMHHNVALLVRGGICLGVCAVWANWSINGHSDELHVFWSPHRCCLTNSRWLRFQGDRFGSILDEIRVALLVFRLPQGVTWFPYNFVSRVARIDWPQRSETLTLIGFSVESLIVGVLIKAAASSRLK